jgi:small subunit ribosomal protein S15
LSAEITMLQWHLALHAKDVDAKRSLFKKVARRRKFLKYLKQNELEIYLAVSKKLDMKV